MLVNEYSQPVAPQTLVNATVLCYIQAFFGLIGSGGIVAIILIGVGQGAVASASRTRSGGATHGCLARPCQRGGLLYFGSAVFGFPVIIRSCCGAARGTAGAPDDRITSASGFADQRSRETSVATASSLG
jgi:hypothetical protein